MLIAYDPTTGRVLGDTGTNIEQPLGPPIDRIERWLQNIGGSPSAVVRLHDVNDASLIAQLRRAQWYVDPATGEVVIEHLRPTLTADRETITADGTDPVVVRYQHAHNPPASITFIVNRQEVPVDVTDGIAEVEITTVYEGPIETRVRGMAPVITTAEAS